MVKRCHGICVSELGGHKAATIRITYLQKRNRIWCSECESSVPINDYIRYSLMCPCCGVPIRRRILMALGLIKNNNNNNILSLNSMTVLEYTSNNNVVVSRLESQTRSDAEKNSFCEAQTISKKAT